MRQFQQFRKFVLALSGVHADVLEFVPSERARFESLGWAVLITSCLAAISMWFALATAVGINGIIAIPFALIWGLSYLSYRFVEIPGRNLITSVFLPKRESGAGVARPTQPASTVQISVEREASLRPATPDQI